MKKIFLFITILLSLFILSPNVKANSYQINLNSEDNYLINDLITITISLDDLKDINGGLIGLQGTITYDNNRLEYISTEYLYPSNWTRYEPYLAVSGEIRYCDYDETAGNDPILSNMTIMKITFKAIKEGTAEIGFSNNVPTKGADIDFKNVNSILGLNKTINIKTPVGEDNISVSKEVKNVTKNQTTKEIVEDKKEITSEITEDNTEEKEANSETKKTTKKNIFQKVIAFFRNLFK